MANKPPLVADVNLPEDDFPRDPIAKKYRLRGDLIVEVTADAAGITVTKKDGTTVSLVTAVLGEMKQGLMTSMPAGWVRIMGQEVSTLTPTQQAVLSSLRWGASGYLTLAGAVLGDGAGALGSFEGRNSISIEQANLPSCNFTGNTDSSSHTHTLSDTVPTFTKAYASGTVSTASNTSATQSKTTSSSSHTHAVTVSSGGSNVPIDTTPLKLLVATWIYLGE